MLRSALVGVLLLTASPALAVELPDGTCSGGGMTVRVKGGKIVAYSFQGTSYPVRAISASAYKIGEAGRLRVRSPKGKTFKGTFTIRGYDTPATFKCR